MPAIDPGTLRAALGIVGLRLDYADQVTHVSAPVQSISLVDAILAENSVSSNKGKSLIRAYWLGSPDIPEPTISLREFIDAFLKAIIAVFQARGYQNIAEELRRQHNLDRILGDIAKRIDKFESDSITQQDAIRRFLKIMPGSVGNISDFSDVDATMFDSTETSLSYTSMVNSIQASLPFGGGSVDGFIGELYKRLVLDSLRQVEDRTDSGASVSLVDSVKVLIKNQTNTASLSDADTVTALARPENAVLKSVWDAVQNASAGWTNASGTGILDVVTNSASTWSSILAQGTQEGSLDLSAIGLSSTELGKLRLTAAVLTTYVTSADSILTQLTTNSGHALASVYTALATQIGTDYSAMSSANAFTTTDANAHTFANASTAATSLWAPGDGLTTGTYYYNEADGLFYNATMDIVVVPQISLIADWNGSNGYATGDIVRSNNAYYRAKQTISQATSSSKVPGTSTADWQEIRVSETYNASRVYNLQDYVLYNGELFEALSQNITAGTLPPGENETSDYWHRLEFTNTSIFSVDTSYVFQIGLLTKSVQQATTRLATAYSGYVGSWDNTTGYSAGNYVRNGDDFYYVKPGVTITQKSGPTLGVTYTAGDVLTVNGVRYIVSPSTSVSITAYDSATSANYTAGTVVMESGSYWKRTSATIPTFSLTSAYNSSSGALLQSGTATYHLNSGETITQQGTKDVATSNFSLVRGDVVTHSGVRYIAKAASTYTAPESNQAAALDTYFANTTNFEVYTGPSATFFSAATPTNGSPTYWTASSATEWITSKGANFQVYNALLTDFFQFDAPRSLLIDRYQGELQALTQKYKTFLSSTPSKVDSIATALAAARSQIVGLIDGVELNFTKLKNGIASATTDAAMAVAIKQFIDVGLNPKSGLLLPNTMPSGVVNPTTFTTSTTSLATNNDILNKWLLAIPVMTDSSDPRQKVGDKMRSVIQDIRDMIDGSNHIAITQQKRDDLSASVVNLIDELSGGFDGVARTLSDLSDRISGMVTGTVIDFSGTYQSAAFFKVDSLRQAFDDFGTPLNWDVGTEYTVGRVIKRGSVYYKAIAQNTGFDPSLSANSSKWRAINLNVHVTEQALAMRTLASEIEGSLNFRYNTDGNRLVTVLSSQEGISLQEAMLNVFQLENQGGVSGSTATGLRVRAFDATTNPGSAELYYLYTLRQIAYYDDPGRDPTYWKSRRDAAIARSAPAPVGTSGSTGLLAQLKTKYRELSDDINMASESSRTVCDTNSNRLTYLNSGQMSAMMSDFDTIRNDMIGLLNEINNTLTRTDFTSSSRYTSSLAVSASEMTTITGAGYSVSGVGTTWSTDITSDTSLFANNTAGNTTVKFFAPIAAATTAILKQLSGLQNFFHNTSSTVNVGMYGQAIQGSLYQFASWGSLNGRFQDVFYDLYNNWGDFSNHFAGYRVRRTGASNGNIHVDGWSDGTWGSVDATRYFGDKLDDAYDFAKSHFNTLNSDLNSWTTKYNDFHLAVVTQAELWVSRAYATTSPGEDVMFRSVESDDISPEERRLMAKVLNLLMSMLVAMLSSNAQVRAAVFRLMRGEITLDQLGSSLRISQSLANNLIQRAAAMAADMLEREKSNKAASADFVASNPISAQTLYDLASFWQANQSTDKEIKDVARQQRRYS